MPDLMEFMGLVLMTLMNNDVYKENGKYSHRENCELEFSLVMEATRTARRTPQCGVLLAVLVAPIINENSSSQFSLGNVVYVSCLLLCSGVQQRLTCITKSWA